MMAEAGIGLAWTGHPLVDAGAAALAAFAGKADPGEVTAADVMAFEEFAERAYLTGDLAKTVGVLFTSNSFLNPALKEPQRRERVRLALTAFEREGDPAVRCVYCSRPSVSVLYRDDIPMLLGRGVVNFYAEGAPGLPICGPCQVSLHGLTVGAPRCSGRALVVQTDSRELLMQVERVWVRDAVRFAELAALGSDPPKVSGPRTRLVEALLMAQERLADDEQPNGMVAYHLSNSGQGPGMEIYQLPSSIMRFLRRTRAQRTAAAWREIERRAWQRIKTGQSADELAYDERLQYQNYVYEDLFRLPEEASRFIRIYFLRNAAGLVRAGDPRGDYGSLREAHVVSWELTALFLREVLNMDQPRIEAIRELGDRLADEIKAENDQRLFRNAYLARDYWQVRRLLIGANFRQLQRASAPVITFDQYLAVFEEGEELARVDWRLAWDLLLIRLIEQLHQNEWLSQHREELEQAVAADDVEQASTR